MVYVTGDMHGDFNRFTDSKIKKLKKDDVLIICGDFGFIWDGSKKEVKTLEEIGKFKFTTLFVDGKHENFDLLNEYEKVNFGEEKAQHISGNLFRLLRGKIYTIDNKKIFAFGGGESSDKENRVQLGTWWQNELPDISEMKEGVEALNNISRKVDYIITHEPPAHIKSLIDKSFEHTNPLNTFFDDVSKEIQYKKWFFGCLHIDKRISKKHHALFLDVVPLED